ncbi:MAG: NAD(P)/FAD-dependent oxidoreductase [Planctomycetota bacterium]|jgi:phytoene dehydrogenase-like protein|nr:amine oxidase [Deltaproteobacteria bacterium]MDP6540795.1 NAD(P)/FAD-dependent oxidoreductase [Planctomycetota bacterium]
MATGAAGDGVSDRFDAIVVGGGHNGLTAAAYLARAGRRTLLLERRPLLGGACVTEELWPGYRVSRAAYVAGLVRPAVVRELSLDRHGLRFLPRDPSSFTPLPDGRGLLMGRDASATAASVAVFSPKDAERLPAYEAMLDRTAQVVEPLLDAPPPDPSRLRRSDLRPLVRSGRAAWRLRKEIPEALSLLLGPARPVLEAWFESEPLRGTLATDALIGAWAGPSTPGTGYVLFHHVMGETGGARGVWAYVQGGMGAFAEALGAAAEEAGATIQREAPVARILVEEGRARGVQLEDGRIVEAPQVLSGADPRHTFLTLVGRDALPPDFARAIEAIDMRSPVVKINAALDRLPVFRGHTQGPSPGPEHRGTIHLGAIDLDALEASHDAARRGELPLRPMVELTLPSVVDESVAPEGRHLASLFVQHVPPELDAAGWKALRPCLAERVFALVDEVAPGFSESVLHHEVLAPPDLERIFGLAGGNIFHGAMTPDRLAFLRPVPGYGRYATPIAGLTLCGAGAHPGGGVMGACGRNAALELLRSTR